MKESGTFISKLLDMADFSEEEITMIVSRFKLKQYQKNDYILKAGNICNHLYFIEEGLVYMYHLSDGREITTYLGCDNCFIASAKSFLLQEVSLDYIRCIHPTVILEISYEDMQYLYQTIPNWNIVGRKLMEDSVVCLYNRLISQHHIKAKDRYLNFTEQMSAKIVQYTPIQHIATFLGIAPESLSRIRKEVAQEAFS